jgi:hypothetical protein
VKICYLNIRCIFFQDLLPSFHDSEVGDANVAAASYSAASSML